MWRLVEVLIGLFILVVLAERDARADCVYVGPPQVESARNEIEPTLVLEITRLLREAGHGTTNSYELGYVLTDRERLVQVGFTHRVTAAVLQIEPQVIEGVASWTIALAVTRVDLKSGLVTWSNTVRWQEPTGWVEQPQPLVEKIGQALQEAFATYPRNSQRARICWRAPSLALSKLDRDRDGIPDVQDRCPDAAEDSNGYQDADGCPENLPLVEVRVHSRDDQPLDASVKIAGTSTMLRNTEGKFLFPLQAGIYQIEVAAEGFESENLTITVPLKRPLEVKLAPRATPEPVVVRPEPPKPVRSKPQVIEPEVDTREVLLAEVNRLCNQAENRACLNALDAYLKVHSDPAANDRRGRIARQIEATMNELYERGLKEFRLERLDEAIKIWEEALSIDPENRKVQEAYEKAARIRKQLGR